MEEKASIEPNIVTPASSEEFVQGEKSEKVERAITFMKELCEKYEKAEDSAEKVKLSLYEFPKMMDTIREVEVENIARRDRGENEFHIEKEVEYRKMKAHGLTREHIERQKELAEIEFIKENTR